MLLPLRPSPYLPLRRFLCRCSSPPPDLASYKASFAHRMAMTGIQPHHRIALGVSGGPDSMALCVLTARWKLDGMARRDEASGHIDGLLGIVVDHRLRPESSEEAKLVRDRVNKMGVRCEIACCDWHDRWPKQGHLQEAAREMRYQKFLDLCIKEQIGILLIAHHVDDQAELFILRLSRNSGVLGLAGMAFISQIFPPMNSSGRNSSGSGILLVRPMLEFSKDDMYKVWCWCCILLVYTDKDYRISSWPFFCFLGCCKICKGGNQVWVEDPTNQSMAFARNRIRTSLRSLSSCSFRSDLQRLMSACRMTRSYVNHLCHDMMECSVTIIEYGYAIIDLEKLKPSDADDLCLSQYLAYVVQFISQRQRPLRGRSARLLMEYFRNIPCKTALTVAGCYLCAAPRSKGRKILVCCSVDSQQSFRADLSYKCSNEEWPSSSKIDQVIRMMNLPSNKSLPNVLSLPFLNAKCPTDVLNEAKKLDLISDSTLEGIYLLQQEENEKFHSTKEVKSDQESLHGTNINCTSSLTLQPGQTCHFMSRFFVTWAASDNVTVKENCDNTQFCMVDREKEMAVRHMVDADLSFLAEVAKNQTLGGCHACFDNSTEKLQVNEVQKVGHSTFVKLSAKRALETLRSVPLAAKRALPVIISSQGLVLAIPSIGFSCCPCLSVNAVFRPRVPLGGGFISYG